MRPTITVGAEDSIERGVLELRRNGGGIIPVVTDGLLVGVLNEKCLAYTAAEAIPTLNAIGDIMARPDTIAPYSSGSEALRLLSDLKVDNLVVVDDHKRVMGLLSPSDLFPRRRVLQRPSMVGGMATPFGVYLTTGAIRGGVPLYAVMATGSLMIGMFILSAAICSPLTGPINHSHLPNFLKDAIPSSLPLIPFMLMMRLLPLSGTHAAEHMTVHAIERGEELTPEVVARMPRVHPRCGTNLAVALTLFLTISLTEWTSSEETRYLVAAIITLFSWRSLGSFAQQYITTRKPNAAQLRSGIKAGNDLIQKYSVARSTATNIPTRIWNSGMIHVFAGSGLTILVLKGLSMLFHFSIPGVE